jgi:hypothetical protein
MLVTIVRILFGFLAACLAAAVVQVLFVAGEGAFSLGLKGIGTALADHSELILLAATQIAVFAAPFALLAAAVAAWQPIRSLRYFLAAGGAIGLAGLLAQYAGEREGPTILNVYAAATYATAGLFAGLVYWMLAGSSAVSHRETKAKTPER